MRRILLASFVVLASCAAKETSLPFYEDTALTPRWKRASDSIYRIGNFALVDQQGRQFTADSLDGRVHVAHFFFARCGDICPLTTRNLQDVAATFASEPRFLIASYSVSPHADSVPALRQYAHHFAMNDDRWRLLTGDPAVSARVAQSYLVGRGRGRDYGVDSVAHTEMLVLVDANRHIRGVYNGTLKLDVQQMTADIRTLLANRNHVQDR